MQCVKCKQEIMEGSAFCPYCGQRVAAGNQEADKPIYQAEVKGLFKSGKLTVYCDRVEFSTSSIQKTVFNYSTLVSVKKRLVPTPAILFITENGQTEACNATTKNIHEAFLHIEQAARPYIEERKQQLLAQGIKYSFVSSTGPLSSGVLYISDDKVEFKAKSGQGEIIGFERVKSVHLSASGALELSLFSGEIRTFALEKEIRDEVLAFVEGAVAPFLAQRKETLLARGIYYSFLSYQGQDGGNLDIFADRAEFTAKSGRVETVEFRNVRAVSLISESLELFLTDGTSRVFTIDREVRNEVLSFVQEAIVPYVEKRTAGFGVAFGMDERIEINQERRVFHILRQGGAAITEECSIEHVIACRQEESTELNRMLAGVMSGGRAIMNKAAGAVGKQGMADTEELLRSLDIVLIISTEEGQRMESVRFGDFPLGMSRTNPKYAQYAAEVSGFMDYMSENYPECELIIPESPKSECESVELLEERSIEVAGGADDRSKAQVAVQKPAEKDMLGIGKYIEGVSGFICDCDPPMTIAVQENFGSGKTGILKMISDSLEQSGFKYQMWFSTRTLFHSNGEDSLPILVGKELIRQVSGACNGTSKDSAVKIAKGVIELLAGAIAPDTSAAQNLVEGLFRDGSSITLEELVKIFSELIKKQTDGEKGKFVIFINDLDRLTAVKAVEFLEVLRDYSDCEGCVFVIAIDYGFFLRGMRESFDTDGDESKGQAMFDEIFHMYFRVPASGFHIGNYVRGKFENLGIRPDTEKETGFYAKLIECSVGSEPKNIDRLFNSFRLLKNMADGALYENKLQRMMLFALLCMQTRFRSMYDQLIGMKDRVTPEVLSGLCREDSEVVSHSGLSEEDRDEFRGFAEVLYDIIDSDDMEGISMSECGVFTQVLEVSSITSR